MAQDAFVLVVDDDEPSVTLMALYLDVLGYEHRSALSGGEALKLMRANPDRIGLVVLDLAMPQMNGYEVCETMRADPALVNIPVIALTANVEVELEEKVHKAGFNGLITKPFTRKDLESALTDHYRFA
jgi:CheY-like chemotaxis protein